MQPSPKRSTCSIVVDHILDMIANKTLNTDDKLPPERDLALQLEVSRATVREAIKVLNYLGFIDSSQGSGNYVTAEYDRTITNIMRISYARGDISFEDFTIFRQMLELQAFELAIHHSTESLRSEMKQIVDLLDTTTDVDLIIRLDGRLHKLLVEASSNLLILITYHALSAVTAHYMADTFWNTTNKKKGGFEQLQKYHHAIVDSLIAQDVERGKQAICNHFKLFLP